MRFSGGGIRRTNSVNPLRGIRGKPDGLIRTAETLYTSLGRKPIFRVPHIADDLDDQLRERGYGMAAGSAVLFCDLAARSFAQVDGVLIEREMSADWHNESHRIGASSELDHTIFAQMIATIVIPKAFVSIRADGKTVAKAYGAIDNGLLVVESVATDPDYRQRGYSRKILTALMGWAKREGAEAACLQVLADNTAARALYASLGFDHELYRYHYRMNP
ncbi:acetyltransferase [Phyllobacterium sp. YR531]|nr:acetyltransferase [Phyllobacterium sp. YR531]